MLRPGKHDETTDTMAAAMEAAFLAEWQHFNGDLPKPEDKKLEAMRLLFVAVAQGVVQHLRDNAEAFTVSVVTADHSHTGGAHVHGDGSHSHSGGGHTHSATVSSITTDGTIA